MRFDQTDFKSFLTKFDHFVDLKDVHCGEKARDSMKKLTQKDKSVLQLEIKNFFIESVKHLTLKIKDFTKMKYFKCLSPENIKDNVIISYITKIAGLLPLKDVDTDEVSTEWKLLQKDEDVSFSLNKNERIDDYWNHIFLLNTTSNYRYPVLKYVVQNSLAITHGSADFERDFPKSGQILTDKNSIMIERTLNAKLAIVDGLKQYGFQIHKLPMTNDLLKRARHARQSYLAYLEEKKRLDSENLAKQAVEAEQREKEKELLANITEEKKDILTLEADLQNADKAFAVATKNSEAIQKTLKSVIGKDPTGVAVQKLMKSLENFRTKEKDKRNKVDQSRKKNQN